MGKVYYKLVEFYEGETEEQEIKLVHIPTKDGSDMEAVKKFKKIFPGCELIEVYNEDYQPQYEGMTEEELINKSYETLNQ